jgi:hypothetical protein
VPARQTCRSYDTFEKCTGSAATTSSSTHQPTPTQPVATHTARHDSVTQTHHPRGRPGSAELPICTRTRVVSLMVAGGTPAVETNHKRHDPSDETEDRESREHEHCSSECCRLTDLITSIPECATRVDGQRAEHEERDAKQGACDGQDYPEWECPVRTFRRVRHAEGYRRRGRLLERPCTPICRSAWSDPTRAFLAGIPAICSPGVARTHERDSQKHKDNDHEHERSEHKEHEWPRGDDSVRLGRGLSEYVSICVSDQPRHCRANCSCEHS